MIQTTINTVATANGGAHFNKTFYDKKLLETARTKLVFAKFGQKRSIPKNSGKRVEFRRYDLFAPELAAIPLVEGVTPEGQSLSQSNIEAEVAQYGAYVEVSDLLDLTAYDEVVSDSAELLGEQLGTVVEWITRDAICAGTNVQYAGGGTSRESVDPTNKLTVDEIRKAVRSLKRAKARPFQQTGEGTTRKAHYVCVCSPEATYDLQSDPLWQDISKYSNAEQLYSGEIGRLFGVVFVESTEAKVFRQSVHTSVAAHSANSETLTLFDMPPAAYLYLSQANAPVMIGNTRYTVVAANAAEKTITLSAPVPTAIVSGTLVYSEDGGKIDPATKKAMDVHGTLLFGADAYGVIDVMGAGALQTIVKLPGSSGALDPLNQRGSVGAKVAAYTAAILNPLWIVRVEHAVSF